MNIAHSSLMGVAKRKTRTSLSSSSPLKDALLKNDMPSLAHSPINSLLWTEVRSVSYASHVHMWLGDCHNPSKMELFLESTFFEPLYPCEDKMSIKKVFHF